MDDSMYAASPSDFSLSTSYDAASPSNPSTPSADTPKRKRKQWGQHIPEINPVIGPRKRAKTAEEKEQRKNERILRNRRAADKSRQRQKQAQAVLQLENERLRAELARYKMRFGQLDHSAGPSAPTPAISLVQEADYESSSPTPAMSYDSPMSSYQPPHHSPALAPTLFQPQEQIQEPDDFPGMDSFENGLTQYPAAILCDLQCQPLSKDPSQDFPVKYFNFTTQMILLIALAEINQTCSTSMVCLMMSIFHLLVQILSTPSMDEAFLNTYFHLIHCLISTPTSTTGKAKFRTMLLSRLLSCSPRLPRLLMAAADRALQDVVSSDGFVSDAASSWNWASLMTMKWTILTLEREHARYRDCARRLLQSDSLVETGGLVHSGCDGVPDGVTVESKLLEHAKMAGVDYTSVRKSLSQWVEAGSMDSFQIDDNLLERAQPIESY